MSSRRKQGNSIIMSSEEDTPTITSPQNMRKTILRNALKTAQSLSENVNKNTISNLEFIMDKTDIVNNENNLESIVNDHEEVVLDAQVLSLSSQIMRRCTLHVTKELNNYDPVEFAMNIKLYLQRHLNTEEPNWSVLDEIAIQAFQILPQYSSLQGFMKPIQAKEATVKKQQVKREARMPAKRPKCVTVAEKEEESIEDSVEKIRRLVHAYYERTNEPLHFFKLVLHPTNFGRTVENLLHTSFLLRDGVLKLFKDNRGAIIVELVPKKVLHAAKKSGKAIGIQNVFSINKDDWGVLVKAYNITKPMVEYEK